MLDTDVDELERLRRTNADLAACLALPALWGGREPPYIVATLVDVLVSMLELDLGYAVIRDTSGTATLEEWRPRGTVLPAWIAETLERWPDGDTAGRPTVHLPKVGDIRLARVPLRLQHGGGMVVAAALRGDFPTERDTALLRAAVNQAGIALNHAYLALGEQKLLKSERAARAAAEAAEARLAFLGETARSITSALALDTVLQRIVEGAKALCGSNTAAIFLRESDSETMLPRYRVGPSVAAFDTLRINPGQGLGGLVLQTKKPARTAHYLTDDRISADFHEIARRTGTMALMIVPLLVADRVEGLLHVSNTTGQAFSDDDQAICIRLAEQAAIAIQNALLFRAEQAARTEAEVLAALAVEINTALDVGRVLQRVAEAARDLCAGDLVRIALREPDGAMVYRYLVGAQAAGYEQLRLETGKGFVGRVLESGRPFRTADAASDPAIHPEYGRQIIAVEGTKTAMVVPIYVGGLIEGLIYVGRRTATPFSDDDERVCSRLTNHAATAIRNAHLFAGEQAARAAADAANRAKDEFLAILSHELRSPLSAIVSAVSILDRVGNPADLPAKARAVIHRQAAQLRRLVDDLLDVTRLTTRKLVLNRRPVNVAELVDGRLNELAIEQRFDSHRLERQLERAWVEGDPARLEQIVNNLLVNSIKYTPSGGVIRVEIGTEGNEAVLRVRDGGIGMAPELLARIFDLFVQGDPGITRQQGGLGIGLTLVRFLVDAHGGRVEAHSAGEGCGSEFIVRLPLTDLRVAERQPPTVEPRSADHRRVLIVEDNADERQALRAVLELGGHEVHEAADGTEGVELALCVHPDAVFIDIGLPGLDGYEMARRLKAKEPGVRLIALTGYGQPEDHRRGAAAGFDAYLVKPVALESLVRVLIHQVPPPALG